jgi:hypothetical protein
MYDIKVLNNKCKMGGGDVGPQCFVKDLLWVVNLVCKKEDSVSCWFKTHQPRQGQRPNGRFFCVFYLIVLFVFCCFFFTDLKTSLNNFIPVHLTVISPHHRRLCFYFWTFVCSNCDIFHQLGMDKGRCKTTLAQNTHNHLNRLLYLYKCK